MSRRVWLAGADGSVVSRGLGVLRLSLLALAIGQGLVANAFATASLLPYLISLVLTGGVLGSTLLPQLLPQYLTPGTEVARAEGAGATSQAQPRAGSRGRGWRPAVATGIDRGMALILGGLLLLTIVCVVAAGPLVRTLGSGLSGSLGDLTASFAAITLVQVFLYGVCGVLGRVLLRRRRLGTLGWAPAAGELVGIAGLVVFMQLFQGHVSSAEWTRDMIWWLAGSTTVGITVQALVLAAVVWRSRPDHPVVTVVAPEAASGSAIGMTTTGTPASAWAPPTSRWLGWGSVTVLLIVASYVVASQVMWRATGYDEVSRSPEQPFVAGLTILVNALVVVLLPHALLTRPLLVWVHRGLATAIQQDDRPDARSRVIQGLTLPAVITIPGSIALVVFALPIMGLLFTSKDPAEVLADATVLACLAPALFPMGVALLGRRACEALRAHGASGALTALLALTSIGVSVLAAFAPREWATPLVAFGLVLGNVAAAAYGIRVVRRRIGPVAMSGIVRTWVRIFLAAAGGGYAAWGLVMVLTRALAGWSRIGYAVTLVIGTAVFTVIYLLVARLLRVDEVSVVAAPLINRLDRRPPGRHRPGD